MELSIDTSTRYAAVGLSNQGETAAEISWRSERNHSVELVPAIHRLLEHARVEIRRLEAVFVARGPGAFSALRVGMSTAKALAMALNIPIVSVGTLDVEAHPYRGLGVPVEALIGAGASRLYVGSYPEKALGNDPAYEVLTHNEWESSIAASETLYCGEALVAVADVIKQRLGERARLVLVPPPTRRPGVLADMGYRRLHAGDVDDPASLQPIYLRAAQVASARRAEAGL